MASATELRLLTQKKPHRSKLNGGAKVQGRPGRGITRVLDTQCAPDLKVASVRLIYPCDR